MGKVRVAQKVFFPTITYDNDPQEVPNDVIAFDDPDGLSIKESPGKSLVEIYVEFPLTSTQVKQEPVLKTCKTLARMAAKALALAEDTIIFQGNINLPGKVKADRIESAAEGLLGEAYPYVLDVYGNRTYPKNDDNDEMKITVPIDVKCLQNPPTSVTWGENVFSAVAKGIALLTGKAQAQPYALILPTQVYADTFVPPSPASLITTQERLTPLCTRGFYGTGTLPADQGLLVALGGDPITLHLGREAAIDTSVIKKSSKFIFRVVERIQFVVSDPRALVLLRFEQPPLPPQLLPHP